MVWIRFVENVLASAKYRLNYCVSFVPPSLLSLCSGIRVWDIISELVCLCTVPSPSNPFALDMCHIKNLSLPDRFFVTGALLNFLEMYVVYGNRDEMHYDKGRKSACIMRGGSVRKICSGF